MREDTVGCEDIPYLEAWTVGNLTTQYVSCSIPNVPAKSLQTVIEKPGNILYYGRRTR
jgi:hypothetical protein